MLEVIKTLLGILGCLGVCYVLFLAVTAFAIYMICNHPELSNEKVKYITKMTRFTFKE